jgi:hypothetical protein
MSSSMVSTGFYKPRITGFPWQICGSMVMRSRNWPRVPPLHFGVLAAPATICLYEDDGKLDIMLCIKCGRCNFIIWERKLSFFTLLPSVCFPSSMPMADPLRATRSIRWGDVQELRIRVSLCVGGSPAKKIFRRWLSS